jgi:hypothetical protein
MFKDWLVDLLNDRSVFNVPLLGFSIFVCFVCVWVSVWMDGCVYVLGGFDSYYS